MLYCCSREPKRSCARIRKPSYSLTVSPWYGSLNKFSYLAGTLDNPAAACITCKNTTSQQLLAPSHAADDIVAFCLRLFALHRSVLIILNLELLQQI